MRLMGGPYVHHLEILVFMSWLQQSIWSLMPCTSSKYVTMPTVPQKLTPTTNAQRSDLVPALCAHRMYSIMMSEASYMRSATHSRAVSPALSGSSESQEDSEW